MNKSHVEVLGFIWGPEGGQHWGSPRWSPGGRGYWAEAPASSLQVGRDQVMVKSILVMLFGIIISDFSILHKSWIPAHIPLLLEKFAQNSAFPPSAGHNNLFFSCSALSTATNQSRCGSMKPSRSSGWERWLQTALNMCVLVCLCTI